MSKGLWRSRAVGAAMVAILATGSGTLFTASATISDGDRAVFVPITPCRLFDTRPGLDNVGPRSTPLAGNETHIQNVRGSNGDCTIPTEATAVAMNVAIVFPTGSSFLTVFPADAERPLAANLNWVAGQDPTPNAVTARLSADGRLGFYNLAGDVHLAVDVVGYFADHDHDDRYYTKAQVDTAVAGRAPAGHLHDDRYPTDAEVLAAIEADTTPVNRLTLDQIALGQWWLDPARPLTVTGAPATPTMAVFDGTHLWVTSQTLDAVVRVDPRTGAVGPSVPVCDAAFGVTFDGSRLWVTCANNQIARVDVSSLTEVLPRIALGSPRFPTFDGSRVWVPSISTNSVHRFDVATGTEILPAIATGAFPVSAVFDGTSVWVSNLNADTVSRVNPSTGAKVDVLGCDGPAVPATDGHLLWVPCLNTDTVIRITAAATPFGGAIAVGDAPEHVAFDGQHLWVVNAGSDSLSRVHASSGAVLGSAPVGDSPRYAVFDGMSIWVLDDGTPDTLTRVRP